MSNYKTILIKNEEAIATVWLNRSDRHNALNPVLMREVIHYFQKIENDTTIRIVVIRGKGKSFCAGADLNWMKESANLSEEENKQDSRLLADFFSTIYYSSKITIAITHGNIYGGGNGLVAACDLSLGLGDCRFSFSETRLGLIAATITPLMLQRLHPSVYKLLVFSALSFNGTEAQEIGLLNKVFSTSEMLEEYLKKINSAMLQGGPNALSGSKRLINDLLDPSRSAETKKRIPDILATIRVGDEAREGFAAFLEKRKPDFEKFRK